jgi:hypothetical protein
LPIPEYTINFYDSNLDLNQTIVISSETVDLSQLIANYDLPTPLYEANSSTDISSSTINISNNINLYAISNVQEIRNEVELNNVRNNLSGNYILLSDITLTNTTLDETEGWLPIGDYYDDYDFSYTFTGILNGNNHTISDLWIDRPSTSYIGLFGAIYNAQVKNLEVEINNSNGGVRGYNFVGGIAGGVLGSNISNSYSTGDINGNGGVGGIVGYISESNVSNSYSTGNISGNGYFIGGIMGFVYNSNIASSYSSGSIDGNEYAGGIAGAVVDSVVMNNVAINPSINGNSNVNRVVGGTGGNTISNNLALNSISVSGNNDISDDYYINGEGKSEAELKTQSTYESLGWSFGDDNANPWKIDENSSYPYFYWQE